MHRSGSWDQKSVSTFSTEGSWTSMPPFALDEDRQSLASRSSLQSRGYRDGGPKEARLHRVAFLSLEKDVSHLHPVKVQHLPPNTTPERLKRTFESKIGDVQDVYVPLDAQRNKPVTDFAVIRFGSPESVQRALASPSEQLDGLQVSPLSKQRSFFSGGTGYHGIHNEPVEDGTYVRGMGPVQQDISLNSCMSRSGYPWGSIRELKYLPPRIPSDARDTYALHLQSIPTHITAEEMQEYFSHYGEVASVNCPKPLVIAYAVRTPNNGEAFVRFFDKRDCRQAYEDVIAGRVQLGGVVVKAKIVPPSYWPSEKTRRYY
eukprot:gene31192-37699_t